MALTNYSWNLDAGIAGALVDLSRSGKILSRLNGSKVAYVASITPTAVNSTVYTLTVDGFSCSYTSDASATAAEISAGMYAAIRASASIFGKVTVVDNAGTYTITAREAGRTPTVSVDANQALVVDTAASSGTTIPVGVAVMDSSDGQTCALPDSDGGTVRVITAAPVNINTSIYDLEIVLSDGRAYGASYTSDGTATVKEIVDALTVSLNAKLPASTVLVSDDDAVMTFTGETAGLSFSVMGGSNADTALWTIAVTTAGAAPDFSYPLAGIALRDETIGQQTDGSGTLSTSNQYGANRPVAIAFNKSVWVQVEDAVTPASPVYVRTTASGSYGKGSIRGTSATGATIQWVGAKFLSSASAGGLAKLWTA